MARYRKVDPRIWNDAKFRALDDQGKLAFFFLLTHPHMTAIGAMRASVPGLAAEIGWSTEAFAEAFRDVLSKGMAEHDEEASLMWLPNFLRYNPPESPNVIKAWVGSLDLLPECGLLSRVVAGSVAFAQGLNKGFAEALPEAFAKGMPYQEQEQEQYTNPPISPQGGNHSGMNSAPQKKARQPRGQKRTFAEWAEAIRANGEKAISDYQPVWSYAERAGLPREFVEIAWLRFKDKYLSGTGARKTYIDWRAAFRDHVESNYLRLWFWSEKDSQWQLTTAGVQADKAAEVAP